MATIIKYWIPSVLFVCLFVLAVLIFNSWVEYRRARRQEQTMSYKKFVALSKTNEYRWHIRDHDLPFSTAYAIYNPPGMCLDVEFHMPTYLEGMLLNWYAHKLQRSVRQDAMAYEKKHLVDMWEKDVEQYEGKDQAEIRKIFDDIKSEVNDADNGRNLQSNC